MTKKCNRAACSVIVRGEQLPRRAHGHGPIQPSVCVHARHVERGVAHCGRRVVGSHGERRGRGSPVRVICMLRGAGRVLLLFERLEPLTVTLVIEGDWLAVLLLLVGATVPVRRRVNLPALWDRGLHRAAARAPGGDEELEVDLLCKVVGSRERFAAQLADVWALLGVGADVPADKRRG